jgi:hypothetical protein
MLILLIMPKNWVDTKAPGNIREIKDWATLS